MTQLQRGANTHLQKDRQVLRFAMDRSPAGADVDFSAYLLGSDGKVSGDGDIVFYGQTADAGGGVSLHSGTTFQIDLSRIRPQVVRIVLCAVVDGGDMDQVGAIAMTTDEGPGYRHVTAGDPLAALILCEIYRHGHGWKIRAVGQGFAGGMAPLARSYGVDVEDAPTAPAPMGTVDLRKKRIDDLEGVDPGLASLAKTAGVSLSKSGLGNLVARVCLVADISGSMRERYLRGTVDRLLSRVLGLALNIDDDGSIDTFAFGSRAHWLGEETAETYRTFTSRLMRNIGLEDNTYYGKVMEMVRDHYRQQPDFGRVPVYVMFLTDGGTNDPRRTETQIIEASREGIFWQFMAVGDLPKGLTRGRSSLPKGFDFLAMLDNMPGRHVDNANFFAVEDPDEIDEGELYALMMAEYPDWLAKAKDAGVLRS